MLTSDAVFATVLGEDDVWQLVRIELGNGATKVLHEGGRLRDLRVDGDALLVIEGNDTLLRIDQKGATIDTLATRSQLLDPVGAGACVFFGRSDLFSTPEANGIYRVAR